MAMADEQQGRIPLRDPVFKGCTRPPMFMGVPLTPLIVFCGPVVILAMYTTLMWLALLPPLIGVLRMIAKNDDQQFRLLGLKVLFRTADYFRGNSRFWKAASYSPIEFEKRKR